MQKRDFDIDVHRRAGAWYRDQMKRKAAQSAVDKSKAKVEQGAWTEDDVGGVILLLFLLMPGVLGLLLGTILGLSSMQATLLVWVVALALKCLLGYAHKRGHKLLASINNLMMSLVLVTTFAIALNLGWLISLEV